MGFNLRFPPLTARQGELLCLHGIKDSAIIEFGPMGTANYYDWAAGIFGILPKEEHYAVHTTDMDLSLGRYEHLKQAISDVEELHHPRIIFILASAVMNVVGVDLEGLIREMEGSFVSPVKVIPGDSFSDGVSAGIEKCIGMLSGFAGGGEKIPCSYSILGAVPDDFRFLSDTAEIKRLMLESFGAKCLCCMPYSCSLSELESLGRSEINLVFRSEALPAAEKLRADFGTPYLYFRPYGLNKTAEMMKKLESITGWCADFKAFDAAFRETSARLEAYRRLLRFYHGSHFEKTVLINASADVSRGISEFLSSELGLKCICRTKGDERTQDLQWLKLINEHPGAVILSDGEDKLSFPLRCGVISQPAVKYKDLCAFPLIGFKGALNILQLIDDCRPQG